ATKTSVRRSKFSFAAVVRMDVRRAKPGTGSEGETGLRFPGCLTDSPLICRFPTEPLRADMLTHTMKAAFAVITLAVALPSQGAITVQHFDGAPGNLPIQIGSATIEYEYSPEDSGYYK